MSIWDKPNVQSTLIEQWNKGISASVIAANIHNLTGDRISRSSVIGKITRLKKSGVNLRSKMPTKKMASIPGPNPSPRKRTPTLSRKRRLPSAPKPFKGQQSSISNIMKSAESLAPSMDNGLGKDKLTMLTVGPKQCADVLPHQDHLCASQWIVCGLPSIDAPRIRQCAHHRQISRVSNTEYKQLKGQQRIKGLTTLG